LKLVLLAVIPVGGAFIAKAIENRLLLPIPFVVILMSFTVAGIVKLRRWQGVQIILGLLAALILLDGLVPQFGIFMRRRKVRFRSTTMRNTKSLFRAS